MSQVRRSVGAFVLATVVAAAVVLIPKPADARELGFCRQIEAAIAYLGEPNGDPLHDALLERLLIVQATYCKG